VIRLNPSPTFDAEVEITVARDAPAEVSIFTFRALGRKRLKSLLILTRLVERNRLRRMAEYVRLCWRLKKLATVVDLLDEIIVSWDGSISEPYSKTNLRLLLTEYPGAHIAIYTGFLKGLNEARRKN